MCPFKAVFPPWRTFSVNSDFGSGKKKIRIQDFRKLVRLSLVRFPADITFVTFFLQFILEVPFCVTAQRNHVYVMSLRNPQVVHFMSSHYFPVRKLIKSHLFTLSVWAFIRSVLLTRMKLKRNILIRCTPNLRNWSQNDILNLFTAKLRWDF